MVSMTSVKTTQEEREILKKAGLVHVTGLDATDDSSHGGATYRIGEKTKVSELGKWDANNGLYVVVTLGGEVWLGAPHLSRYVTSPEAAERMNGFRYDEVEAKFCPNGRGAFVPCSNGDTIKIAELLQRVADPDWDPRPWEK